MKNMKMSNVIFARRKVKVVMRLVKGINDVETLYPDLAKEWDYENNDGKTPDQFTRGSNERINWICEKCGHRWCAKINGRTGGDGCPCCTGRVVVPGKNDLVTLKPELVKEWDYQNNGGKTPNQFTRGSDESINWICEKCGHRWRAIINARIHGNGCPCCAGKVVVPGKNDLATVAPDIAQEWDYENNGGRTPNQFTRGSDESINWICRKCGYRWPANIYARTKGSGCPCCAGKVVVPGKNDLATLEPELVKEWDYDNNDGKTPVQFAKMSNKDINWICRKCGHRWTAKICNRANGIGCPCCSGRVPSPGKNDLATLEPELVKEWDYENNEGKTPDQFAKRSNEAVNWICKECGHRWCAKIYARTRGSGCPCCAGKVVVPGKNDFATLEPELVKEWDHDNNDGKTPDQFARNSHEEINWICRKCGHRWPARIIARTNGRSCPGCRGRKEMQRKVVG